MASFTPILPKQALMKRDTDRRLELRMRTLVADLWRTAANYEPPASPNYRRTNTLKRSWSRKVGYVTGGLEGVVLSSGNVAPYNKYVRGKKKGDKGERQTERMAVRGWMSIEDIMAEEWPAAKRDFETILRTAR